MCVLVYMKRIKLELDISGGMIYIIYFQGKAPCSAKISKVCALTVCGNWNEAEFGVSLWTPHKHSEKNLGFKFNLGSCFAFNQPLKAKKRILMNISSILWV